MGADEVPEGVWEKSPACQALMAREGYGSSRELQGHLLRHAQRFLEERERTLMGWEEAAEGDKLELGAKGIFTPSDRHGMIYVRYQKLAALLKIEGEKNNLDVLKTKETFEDYRVPAL